MARIRSVHPGLFTDEAFAACSLEARLLIIGIWTEADDKGVFEWKPLTLKMKIFPGDAFSRGDMERMLAELEAADIIKRYDVDGKTFGAVRNFRKYQRPQRPNDVHPVADGVLNYVGLKPSIPEHVHEHSVNDSGNAIQMEDGGWKREDGGGNNHLFLQGKTSPSSNTRETFIDGDGVIHEEVDA